MTHNGEMARAFKLKGEAFKTFQKDVTLRCVKKSVIYFKNEKA